MTFSMLIALSPVCLIAYFLTRSESLPMASLQAKFLKFWLKHQHFFGNGDYDPQATRRRMENASPLMRLHRDVRVEAVRAGKVPA